MTYIAYVHPGRGILLFCSPEGFFTVSFFSFWLSDWRSTWTCSVCTDTQIYEVKRTEFTFWNRDALRTLVLKLGWVILSFYLPRALAFCSPLFFPSLHSSRVGSWCILKHVSSQITGRADRPLAYNLNARLIFGLWHHRATCLLSAPKLSSLSVYPFLVPTAQTAAVLTPFLK